MKKDSKARRQGKTTSRILREGNLKLIDLGLCENPLCPETNELEAHAHGLMYAPGYVDAEIVEMMKATLAKVGFKGEVEIEHISRKEFERRLRSAQL